MKNKWNSRCNTTIKILCSMNALDRKKAKCCLGNVQLRSYWQSFGFGCHVDQIIVLARPYVIGYLHFHKDVAIERH